MSSVEQAELRALVVETCARSVSAVLSGSDLNFSRCIISKPYFIKWGDPPLHHAAATQKYVYNQAIQDSEAPRIPRVYDCFDQDTITYLVMEYIETSPTRDATYFHQQTANAIDWLLRLPAPPGAGVGPLGGGYASHPIFKEWTAPMRFSCNEALEIFLNKVQFRFRTFYSIVYHRALVSRVSSGQTPVEPHPDYGRAACVYPVRHARGKLHS